MNKLVIALCAFAMLTAASCDGSGSKATADKKFPRKNILWFDATANFKRFSYKDSVIYYLKKSKDAGVTDVVIDVKPITGEVLYPSKIAPVMQDWDGFKKTENFDLLTVCIEEGHKLGLVVHASTNVFVAGHNFFDRGVVYSDSTKRSWASLNNTPDGLKPITSIKKKYSSMLNPVRRDVQEYELSILKELIGMYPKLDGIILDRVRYDGIEADFSNESREAYEKYAGHKVANFPDDIYKYEKEGDKPVRKEGVEFKKWVEFRAKVISDFIWEARKELKAINPKISYGDYTGSWYPTYYEVGVNWASKEINAKDYFDQATPEYNKFGYAEALDLYTSGCYYYEVDKSESKHIDKNNKERTEAGQHKGTADFYTVEGSNELAVKLMNGKAPMYGGLYVDQYNGHPEQFVRAMKMCQKKSDGVMIFDIVHIINNNWWNELKEGFKN
ncbi:alpha amylase family protein [Solitalea canadensis]|uniref:Glycosyl hydrolase-like 10 domain-containing protein n=1 Tax=Solitalea canadensis (strain ATCC 29591 / DSM 3403 / JCM 21819 / LMG 8368 / NBRC 15130 / NCIMB 12057 / USAM 9D) TaxID=929556 RepID=H8KRU9_SOLCM|nr:alpha amylase family protein [Solitalea canadensis]AFD07737.1 hypothetical protein Solca_2703 [Solitalea canadensis DSM 3403]